MTKSLKWKFVLTGVVLLGAAFFLAPTLTDRLPEWWKSHLPAEKVQLGLDLQGGIHLVLEVEAQKAVENTTERSIDDMKEALRKKDIFYDRIERQGSSQMVIEGVSLSDRERFDAILAEQFGNLKLFSTTPGDRGVRYVMGLTDRESRQIEEGAVDQALETIQNRIDQYGVAEPTIQRQSDNRILVQLPGVKDPDRAIKLIGQTAVLEFKIVDEEHSLDDALKGNVPEGSEILYERVYEPETNRTKKIPLLVKKRTLMTGDVISEARVEMSRQFNQPHVAIRLNSRGSRLFDQIAAENVGKRLAIILDNSVYSAPVIKQERYGGQAVIEGNFTTEEAHDLAIVLRAGSLPAPVEIAEKRAVGPSLGSDSIRQGVISILVGGLLVILFMAVYYRTAGLVADLSLIVNLVMILASLAVLGATLTLPGVAGIVLTLGMAVDANVLIYERMREELRVGKNMRAAVDAGFKRAMLVILDSNITTLVAALVLFQFGTGPVKGFAVTLSIGVFWTVVLAIFFTREIFDYLVLVRRVKTVAI
ncbi:MAG: protein translocase subunit SecD [bacterium]